MVEITPGIYRHYKGGMYELIGIGRHESTLEKVVIYKMLYETDDFSYGSFWVRSFTLSTGYVEVDGRVVPRFEKII